LAATTNNEDAIDQVYNVAVNARTSLNELFALIQNELSKVNPKIKSAKPIYRDFRTGDVRHSQADISKAINFLGYQPSHRIDEGLENAMSWYIHNLKI
jgi:UDP-N-acetylglucosamine 4-epimerase